MVADSSGGATAVAGPDVTGDDEVEGIPEAVAARVEEVTGLSDEALGEQITTFAAHRNAAEFRWLCLIGEFDRRQAWGSWRCRSMAHWLSWRCGTSLHTAREKVRVARALEDLPETCAAFSRGELSYSQVRAISRVAGVCGEGELLVLARHGTAAQLERAVAAFRRVAAADDDERHARQRARRAVSWRYDDDGMFVLHARLAAEHGPRVVAAFEAATGDLPDDDLPEDGRDGEGNVPAGTSQHTDGHRSEGDQSDDTPGDGGGGHGGEHVPAGTSAAAVADAIQAPEGDWPDLAGREVADLTGELGDVIDVASASQRRNADALVRLAEAYLAGDRHHVSSADRHRTLVHLIFEPDGDDPEGGGRLLTGQLHRGPALSTPTLERLVCDASLQALVTDRDDNPLYLGRAVRTVTPTQRRALFARDGGCVFPGCGQTRFVDGHHVTWWSKGGSTDIDNLALLCSFHHDAVHAGQLQMTATAPGRFTFRCGDGRDVPAGTSNHPGDADHLSQDNIQLDLDIDDTTAEPDWKGDPLDLDHVLTVLFQATRRNPQRGAHDAIAA